MTSDDPVRERGAGREPPEPSGAPEALDASAPEPSGLDRLNRLDPETAERELLACCGSRAWAREMVAARRFATVEALLARAGDVWRGLEPPDWLEAFRAHPRIGEREAEAGQTEREAGWSRGEQAGMDSAAEATRRALAEGNAEYEARFGHIYVVCATGRSADEMLTLLRRRLGNDPATELRVAAEEQRKITRLRLEKLMSTATDDGRRTTDDQPASPETSR